MCPGQAVQQDGAGIRYEDIFEVSEFDGKGGIRSQRTGQFLRSILSAFYLVFVLIHTIYIEGTTETTWKHLSQSIRGSDFRKNKKFLFETNFQNAMIKIRFLMDLYPEVRSYDFRKNKKFLFETNFQNAMIKIRFLMDLSP